MANRTNMTMRLLCLLLAALFGSLNLLASAHQPPQKQEDNPRGLWEKSFEDARAKSKKNVRPAKTPAAPMVRE